MKEVKSFRFEVNVGLKAKGEGIAFDVPMRLVGDFQAPDRSQGTLSTTFLAVKIESQFVSIGSATYVTNPETGAWEMSSGPVAPFGNPSQIAGLDPSQIDDLILLGEELLNDRMVYHLAGTAAGKAFGAEESLGTLRVEYWLGKEDALITQIAVNGELKLKGEGGISLEGGQTVTTTVAMTAKFSDFGKAVAIEAPEVKPTPPPPPPPAPPATATPQPAPTPASRLLLPGLRVTGV